MILPTESFYGDSVSQYEPFITEPAIVRVVKPVLVEIPVESESPSADELPEKEPVAPQKKEKEGGF